MGKTGQAKSGMELNMAFIIIKAEVDSDMCIQRPVLGLQCMTLFLKSPKVSLCIFSLKKTPLWLCLGVFFLMKKVSL